jgi:uncharacterized protein with gpF-like domain
VASAPPNTDANQGSDRTQEAAALALLLASFRNPTSTARYNLPALVRQQRIKSRRFAQIRPTNALKADLAAPYFDITRSWAAEIDQLISAYEAGGAVAIQAQLGISADRVAQIVQMAQRRFPGIVQRVEQWHRAQWNTRVKASTGLDVSMFTQLTDVTSDMQATTAWNSALADDLHQQTKSRITTALLAGAAASVPASEIKARIQEAIAKAKKRSAGIGDDQVDKLSRAMDRSRRAAASVTSFIWHHTAQKHPRDWHKARDGQTFNEETAPEPSDRAGVPPFCKCWEEAVLG